MKKGLQSGFRIFRRYSQNDFSPLSLPHSRHEQFLDILKNRYDVMLKMAGLFLLFAIPFISALFFEIVFVQNQQLLFNSNQITYEEYQQRAMFLHFFFKFIQALLILLLTFPLSGNLRVYRLLILGEPLSFGYDWRKGVRSNEKLTFIGLLFFSLAYLISSVLIYYALILRKDSFLDTCLCFAPAFLSSFILLPTLFYFFAQIPLYNNSFGKNFQNAFYFYVKHFGFSLIFIFVFLASFLPLSIESIVWVWIVGMPHFFLFLPLFLLAFGLYAAFVFDTDLNVRDYKDFYQKGFYPLTPEEKMTLKENKKRIRKGGKLKRESKS